MPIITFWSNNEKSIGQTISTAISATVMAMEHNYKVLLVSMDFNDETIENCLGKEESNKEIVKSFINRPQVNLDSGINGLLKMAESNRVSPDIIHDYTKIIFKNRLEVLYSPMNVPEENTANLLEKMKNIILNAARYYDQVIVDLKKGLKYSSQLEILKISDVIVTNIDQGIRTIEKLIRTDEIKSVYNKMIWNICKYDDKSKYNSKNLTRTILKRQFVYKTPYNTLVSDAVQEGKLVELLIRFKTLKGEDKNLSFISEIEELNEGILSKYQETRMRM